MPLGPERRPNVGVFSENTDIPARDWIQTNPAMNKHLMPLVEEVLLHYGLQEAPGPTQPPGVKDFDDEYTEAEIRAAERALLQEGYLNGRLSREDPDVPEGKVADGEISEQGKAYVEQHLKDML